MGRAMSQTYDQRRTATRLLRTRDVAEALGVSTRTVERLATTGELKRIRIGGSTRFSAADVEALVERSRQEAP